jgi:hypothetical protein
MVSDGLMPQYPQMLYIVLLLANEHNPESCGCESAKKCGAAGGRVQGSFRVARTTHLLVVIAIAGVMILWSAFLLWLFIRFLF